MPNAEGMPARISPLNMDLVARFRYTDESPINTIDSSERFEGDSGVYIRRIVLSYFSILFSLFFKFTKTN